MSLTVIVGGLGAVGQMLRRELGADLGTVLDIDPRRGRDAAEGAVPGTVEHDLLRRADTVVLAVHETVALAVLPTLTAVLPESTLLVETLSVKTAFAAAVDRERPPFEVLGINPMFGPSLGMSGRAIVVVPLLPGERTARFSALLAAHGARLTELSAEAHDRATAALQALPHVTLLAFARAFASCQLDLESALRIAPPPASTLLALAARIANGNPHVYSDIQRANPFAGAARDALLRTAGDVLELAIDPDSLGELLRDTSLSLGAPCPALLRSAEELLGGQRPVPHAAGTVADVRR